MRQVASDKLVWCQGIGAVESFATAEMRLVCPLVTAEVPMAQAEDLPVSGVDFLLRKDLAGESSICGQNLRGGIGGENSDLSNVVTCTKVR